MYPLRKMMLVAFAVVTLSLGAATVVQADPIITTVGTPNNASFVFATQHNLVQFTLGSAYTNASIAASLVSTAAGRTGTAYLMTQVGPGTTVANQIAAAGFTFAQVANLSTSLSYVNLFSGLNLGPGTYYVVFAATNTTTDTGISVNPTATYTTAPGASVGAEQFSPSANHNPAYPPASTFINATTGNRFFRVDGTPAGVTAVPEPATMLLLGTGLAGAALRARKRGKVKGHE